MLGGIAPGIVEFVFAIDADDLARRLGQSDMRGLLLCLPSP
jgi:hypothetical protein